MSSRDRSMFGRLYLVVSANGCAGRDFVEVTGRAVDGGVDLVQLREKDASDELFLERALRLKKMLDRRGVPLVINDNARVARMCGAWGVHVGASDASPDEVRRVWPGCASVGLSIERPEQLSGEDAASADCLAVSPVFSTASKTDTITEWGLEGIAVIRALTDKPLIAIGNMNAGNAAAAIGAGADCIAVISAICSAADPERAAAEIKAEIKKAIEYAHI